jgi:ABC-type multidrug transport system ATPase subunit
MPLISAKNLTKSFENVKAVDGIDLTVYAGKITGIVGLEISQTFFHSFHF